MASLTSSSESSPKAAMEVDAAGGGEEEDEGWFPIVMENIKVSDPFNLIEHAPPSSPSWRNSLSYLTPVIMLLVLYIFFFCIEAQQTLLWELLTGTIGAPVNVTPTTGTTSTSTSSKNAFRFFFPSGQSSTLLLPRADGGGPPPSSSGFTTSAAHALYTTNYASQFLGAGVISYPGACHDASAVLTDKADSYMLCPCSLAEKAFVVQLIRDVTIKRVVVRNAEHFSSGVREFTLLGSRRYPAPQWVVLGRFEAQNRRGRQTFLDLKPHSAVRFLKFQWVSSYGSQPWCTMTSFSVYGVDTLESLTSLEEEEDVHSTGVAGSATNAPGGGGGAGEDGDISEQENLAGNNDLEKEEEDDEVSRDHRQEDTKKNNDNDPRHSNHHSREMDEGGANTKGAAVPSPSPTDDNTSPTSWGDKKGLAEDWGGGWEDLIAFMTSESSDGGVSLLHRDGADKPAAGGGEEAEEERRRAEEEAAEVAACRARYEERLRESRRQRHAATYHLPCPADFYAYRFSSPAYNHSLEAQQLADVSRYTPLAERKHIAYTPWEDDGVSTSPRFYPHRLLAPDLRVARPPPSFRYRDADGEESETEETLVLGDAASETRYLEASCLLGESWWPPPYPCRREAEARRLAALHASNKTATTSSPLSPTTWNRTLHSTGNATSTQVGGGGSGGAGGGGTSRGGGGTKRKKQQPPLISALRQLARHQSFTEAQRKESQERAEELGRELNQTKAVLHALLDRYSALGKEMAETRRRQAEVVRVLEEEVHLLADRRHEGWRGAGWLPTAAFWLSIFSMVLSMLFGILSTVHQRGTSSVMPHLPPPLQRTVSSSHPAEASRGDPLNDSMLSPSGSISRFSAALGRWRRQSPRFVPSTPATKSSPCGGIVEVLPSGGVTLERDRSGSPPILAGVPRAGDSATAPLEGEDLGSSVKESSMSAMLSVMEDMGSPTAEMVEEKLGISPAKK